MANVLFYGNDNLTKRFKRSSEFVDIMTTLYKHKICALDTETNVTESILNRELKVISVGVAYGTIIAVFEWDFMSEVEKKDLLEYLRVTKNIIQNVSFDYTVFKKCTDTTLENVWCTMLGEQILTTGLSREQGFHGLQAIYSRRFGVDISKEEQLTFGDGGPYNDEQIKYAAIDVVKLEEVYDQQRAEMKSDDRFIGHKDNKGMLKTAWLENEFVKVVGDMEINGIRLDKVQWYAIEDSVRPIFDRELESLNTLVLSTLPHLMRKQEWYSDKDRFNGNMWTSTKKKLELLQDLFPGIEKTSMVAIKQYLRDEDPEFPEELKKSLNGKKWNAHDYPVTFRNKFAILKLLASATAVNKEEIHRVLNELIITNFRDKAVELDWITPAGKLTLNWASPPQRLTVFQALDPTIESTGKDILVDYGEHEIIQHYLAWNTVEYQLKNFGKPFYDKHVEIDGKHRARYRQILSTGRLSTTSPNILNIPRKQDVYRKAVIPDEGYEFINADFDGQELFITAVLSKEPVWLEAIAKGYDLHSRNAHMIYGDRWISAREPGCKYFEYEDGLTNYQYKKCKCSGHMEMRDNSKALSFGLIYGISAFSLAFRLKIEKEEAEQLVSNFFTMLPNIKKMMDNFGSYALRNGRIVDFVTGRSRMFDKYKLAVPEERGGVERASYNYPIQCAGSALLKISLVLLRRKLIHKGYSKEIQILMPYHDEISIQAKPEYTEEAKLLLTECMLKAASLAGFDGLGATAASGNSWYDAH